MNGSRPPLVAHVIYALTTGGLENGLVNIINRTPVGRYRHAIICITRADEFAQRITAEGVEVYELNKRQGHDFRFYWKLLKLFRELRPDIIHTRNLAALETQLLGITNGGVKRVHGEHGREVSDLEGTNVKYLLLRRFVALFIHRYIAVSKDLERWLKSVVKVQSDKVCQIYNGVDHDKFSPVGEKHINLLPENWNCVEGTLIVGTVGRLDPVKDQSSLLTAVALLRTRHPALFASIRVIIVGDGPLRKNLEDAALKLGIERQVWLAGNRDDVPELYRLMDVFALPSLAEGISNTLLEAMSCGLPVLATRVGGNTEVIQDKFNGRLVPVGDPESLVDVFIELFDNREERLRLATNARRYVCEQFDWSRTVERYLRVYDDLLQPQPQHGTTGTV